MPKKQNASKTKTDFDRPENFINRELSWLEFNDRVLREGISPDVPLLERLKFLSIVSSNLNEFFMIRVAGLMQAARRNGPPDFSGMAPGEQLTAIRARIKTMIAEQSRAIREAVGALTGHGLWLAEMAELSAEQRRFLRSYFSTNVLPVLTPLGVEELNPPPVLPGLKLYLAARLKSTDAAAEVQERVAIVPVPSSFPAFINTPMAKGVCLVRLEDVMGENIGLLFPGFTVEARTAFQIVRDADVAVDEDDAVDLMEAMEAAIVSRRRRAVVRLTLPVGAESGLKAWLTKQLAVTESEIYETEGMLDPTSLMQVGSRPGFDHLKYPDWPAQPARDLLGSENLWEVLQERDVLLSHPYEAFDPVIQLVKIAAEDPNVLAIKQTLYRTSGQSEIVGALARAADNGKQVTVLVELKARFDEAKNVQWAKRLEDAGCFVIYGIAGFKTHAKALLIVRRESHRISRYAHLSTGNYNERTARLYSDVALVTSDSAMTADVAAFFNLLTGYSQAVDWNQMAIAPTGLRQKLLDLIDREAQISTPDRPGLIMVKLNSLQDRKLCRSLYQASQAGVRILLNVRGICCLRPGLSRISENIRVVSIVDRYLEHSRIFYFQNGGHEEVYLSSADWMIRNLDKRLELLFPVQQEDLKKRLSQMLQAYFADNQKSRQLLPDGRYEKVAASGDPVRVQERLFEEAVEAAKSNALAAIEFRPLAKPAT